VAVTGKGARVGRVLIFLNLGVFAAVLLWAPRDDRWWLGILAAAWAWLCTGFSRWLEWRGRSPVGSDVSTSQGPLVIETPLALQTPPPRAVSGAFASRATRHYRTAYPALLALPSLLGVFWFRRTDAILRYEGLATVQALVLVALVLAAVLYVESNVRAVRSLLRDGSVVRGVVAGLSPMRSEVAVRYSFAGTALSVSLPLDDASDLGPGSQVPLLVASGSGLVAIVTAPEKILVARTRR
jgi:hypothetical protein